MPGPLHILIIEDNPADFLLLQRHLVHNAILGIFQQVDSVPDLSAALENGAWDLILSDFSVPGMAFRDSLAMIQRVRGDLPVILVSGSVGEEQAVELMKDGVSDFVLKDNLGRLVPAIRRTLREVSEQRARKNAEAAIRQTLDALERTNTELEHLTFAASHDLQEPVRGIVSFAQLIQRRLGNDIDPELQRDLKYLINSAYRMRGIVSGLTAFSEVTNSVEQWSPQECSDLVDAAIIRLSDDIARTGASISHGALPTVTGNRRQLSEVFYALLSNGLKFARPGVAPRLSVTAEARDCGWHFVVADNGIGIDAQYFDQLFWPFKRLEAHVDYPGPGLGLAIVRRVIEQHGGHIWVESQLGAGTSMHFTLPPWVASTAQPQVQSPLFDPEDQPRQSLA